MSGPYPAAAVPRSVRNEPLRMSLLDRFELVGAGGKRIHLTIGEERLLAFLALHEHEVPRAIVAGRLWPDVPEPRSSGSMRSTLWRIGQVSPGLVTARDGCLALGPGITVDLHELTTIIQRLDSGRLPPEPRPVIARLDSDVLPDWDEDWVMLFREHWRQLRLHALDALARLLVAGEHWATAAEAGLTALGTDPFRETAHEALIRTYLAEGNRPEALRQYRAYVRLLREELDLDPSPRLQAMVERAVTPP